MGGLPANRTVNGFAVDPKNPRAMYAAMRDGIFQSTDAGETWKLAAKELKNLAAVTVNPKATNEIHVATVDGVIFKSTDAGMTWKRQ